MRLKTFEQAIKLGAHAVLAKPISTRRLFDYITWVLSANQHMELVGNLVRRNDSKHHKSGVFDSSGFVQDQQMAEVESLQSDVDRILKSSFY